ncbi:hypothetical protein Bca4012_043527 [Brassica carinata]
MKKRGHDLKKKMKKRGHDLKKKMKKRGHVSSGYGFSGEHRHLRLVDQTVAAFELWWSLQTTPHQLAIGLTELLCSTTSPPQPKASRFPPHGSSTSSQMGTSPSSVTIFRAAQRFEEVVTEKPELAITDTILVLLWRYETWLYLHLYTSPHFRKAPASTSRVMTVCVSSSSWRPLIHFFVKCRSRAPFSIQDFMQFWQKRCDEEKSRLRCSHLRTLLRTQTS